MDFELNSPSSFKKSFKKFLRKATALVLSLAIISSFGAFLTFKTSKPVLAAWLDESWAYRQKVVVNNNAGTPLTNFQVALSIDTASLYAAGKILGNCNDIRITDSDGVTLLPHWVEGAGLSTPCNSSSTKIWVKVPSIPASGTALFIYYGNPNATNIEAPESVFEFFDDFLGSTLDSSKWTVMNSSTGSHSLAGGKLTISSGGDWWGTADSSRYVVSNQGFGSQYVAETRVVTFAGSGFARFFGLRAGQATNAKMFVLLGDSDGSHITNVYRESTGGDAAWYGENTGIPFPGYGKVAKFVVNGDTVSAYYNNSLVNTRTVSGWGLQYPALTDTENYGAQFDWIFVRKYASAEPTTSLESEQNLGAPLAWWKFDDGFGQTVRDSTINHFDGVRGADSSAGSDDPSIRTEDLCALGKCFYFDGGDYILINHRSALNSLPITISFWLRTNVNDDYERGIVNKYASGSNNGYQVFIRNGNIQAWYFKDSSNYIRTESYSGQRFVADDRWHYVVFSVDSSGGKLYLDGVLKLSVPWTGTAGAVTTTQNLRIGAYDGGNFSGFLDDVRIYNYARSAEEIRANFANAGARTSAAAYLGGDSPQVPWAANVRQRFLSDGLIGYWKFDENSWTQDCSSDAALDYSGRNNHARACPASAGPSPTSGKYDKSGEFDGSDDYLVTSNTGPNVSGTSSITISAWIKGDVFSTERWNANPIIVQWGNGGTYPFIFTVTYSKKLGFAWNGAPNTSGNTVLNTGIWYHVVVTYDGTKVRFYINGDLDAENPNTFVFSGLAKTEIGGSTYDHSYFDGQIDEVRIYNRVLSADEIKALYRWAPGPVGYWKFDEGNGYYVNDYSGYETQLGLHVQPSVNPHPWVEGRFGKAWWKAGYEYPLDEEARASNWKPPRQQSFTISVWVKPEPDPPNPTYAAWIASRWWTGTDSYPAGWVLEYSNTTRKVKLKICKDNYCDWQGTGTSNVSSNTALTPGVWTHIEAIHKDGESLSIYINGKLENSVSYTQGLNSTPPNIAFGSNANNNATSFKGAIDEAKVYNYPRTPEQVLEDMNSGHPVAGSPNPSELLYYRLDEGYGNQAANSGNAGSAFAATLNNFAVPATESSGWQTSGRFGKGLALDGSNDYLSLADNDLLSFGNGSQDYPFSISFWTKLNSAASQGFLGKYASSNREYQLYTDSNGRLYAVLWDESAGAYIGRYSSTAPPTGAWTHIALVYDGSRSAAGIKLFINGKRVDSTDYVSGSYTAMENKAADLTFGKVESLYLNGLLDEIKVYNFALSDAAVLTDYNRGGAVSFAGLNVWGEEGFSGAPPIAEWRFEERSGNTANDSSGKAHTGTLTSGPVWTHGKWGSALSFDATDDYVDVGDSDDLTMQNFTLEAWIKWDGVRYSGASQKDFATIISKGKYNSGEYVLLFNRSTANSNNGIWLYINGALRVGWTNSAGFDTNWHFVSATYDGSMAKIYLDGIERASASVSTTVPNTSNTLKIGRQTTPYSDYYVWGGLLDEVKIYNYARSKAQIVYDYNRGAPLAWWKFNECRGSSLGDSSGNGFTGTILPGSSGQTEAGDCEVSGNTLWYNGRQGKFQGSLNFDGSDDYVDLNNASASSLLKINLPLSIAVWVKASSFSSFPAILALDKWDNTLYCGAIFHITTEGKPQLEYGDCTGGGGSAYRRMKLADEAITTGQWYHLVGVIRGPTDMSIYINGREVSGSYSGSGGALSYSSNSSKIGSSSPGIKHFAGQIDDLRLYNYDLTAEMVRKIMNEGAAVRFGP